MECIKDCEEISKWEQAERRIFSGSVGEIERME